MAAKIEDGMTPKQRYFKKKYDEAPLIACACGCGEQLKAVDKYARPVKYVNGHNTRIEEGRSLTDWEVEKRWRVKNPDKMREAKTAFYRKRKLLAMELKGNECSFCGMGYNGKNAAAFEFHHSDPSVKEYTISKMLINKAWDSTLKELEVCVLACANCHNQHHSPGW